MCGLYGVYGVWLSTHKGLSKEGRGTTLNTAPPVLPANQMCAKHNAPTTHTHTTHTHTHTQTHMRTERTFKAHFHAAVDEVVALEDLPEAALARLRLALDRRRLAKGELVERVRLVRVVVRADLVQPQDHGLIVFVLREQRSARGGRYGV